MFRDHTGAMVVRFAAGPQTAVRITRGELWMRWRSPWLWLIAAGVAAIAMICLVLKMAARPSGPGFTSFTWGSGTAVLVAAATIYVVVLLLFGMFSMQDARHGSQRVRRFASPGMVLQARYLSDGMEMTTPLGTRTYLFADFRKLSVDTHVVTLTAASHWLVLPRELVPAQAIAYLERSVAQA
ncbi:hypothetical protein [Nocardia sp.]|uniref:hypothetical protein n=1 Tax=Nocardia sp. TaxID=1821 RepID=UPI0026295E84|nr:hypothetical protein [Nocardia sp.]